MPSDCPFCEIEPGRVWLENERALAIWDKYPCAYGHVLVVPRRHAASVFDLDDAERADLWALVVEARRRLDDKYPIDGFNLGINDGQAAGQTIMHAHVHLIPRREGDVPDPRGGVRWVIPERARYWADEESPDGSP
ncbi:MAG: HIT family protein [Deltaproteobacteria bacterium]|nr:HIT family protein [Deltaproteobacteria bacterium]